MSSAFFVRKGVLKKHRGEKPPFARFKVDCSQGFIRNKLLHVSVLRLERGLVELGRNRYKTFITGQYRFSFLCGRFSYVYQQSSIHIMVNDESRGVLDLPFDMEEPYKTESYVHISAGDSFWFVQDVKSTLGASSGIFLVEPEIRVDVLRVTSF